MFVLHADLQVMAALLPAQGIANADKSFRLHRCRRTGSRPGRSNSPPKFPACPVNRLPSGDEIPTCAAVNGSCGVEPVVMMPNPNRASFTRFEENTCSVVERQHSLIQIRGTAESWNRQRVGESEQIKHTLRGRIVGGEEFRGKRFAGDS